MNNYTKNITKYFEEEPQLTILHINITNVIEEER